MIGHNPKASQNQSDDFRDIVALMQELPRVSAPTDFNASLKARIAVAKAEANEFANVTALIKELPHVAAPSDFDFKLRARIAQAKAEQQKASAGWFAELFGRSFTWAQAGAAMAVVALAVSVVSFGVLRSGESVKPSDNAIATTIEARNNAAPAAVDRTTPAVVEEKKRETAQIIAANNSTTNPPRTRVVKALHSSPSGSEKTDQVIAASQRENSGTIATRTVIIKHRSGEARMVNLSEYNLGLQTASIRTVSASAANKADATFAANIY